MAEFLLEWKVMSQNAGESFTVDQRRHFLEQKISGKHKDSVRSLQLSWALQRYHEAKSAGCDPNAGEITSEFSEKFLLDRANEHLATLQENKTDALNRQHVLRNTATAKIEKDNNNKNNSTWYNTDWIQDAEGDKKANPKERGKAKAKERVRKGK